MKNSKKILVVAMSMIMIVVTIIPSLAVNRNEFEFLNMPNDMGTYVGNIDYSSNIEKYYLKITFKTSDPFDDYYTYQIYDDSDVLSTGNISIIIINNGRLNITNITDNLFSSRYSFIYTPYIFTSTSYVSTVISDYNGNIYMPIYVRNVDLTDYSSDYIDIKIYSSLTIDDDVYREAFQLGYENGYNNGYEIGLVDGAEIVQDLNLVEHCKQLLGTFVGDDYAYYITPLCLALVVIMVYFLFIRWLLALVKSKNVTRVADIIVCTACIIMLVIMYAPMLDLTIHQAQTVYQITADTVVGG